MNRRITRRGIGLGLALVLTTLAPGPAPNPDAGKAFPVPYRRTDTNHFLVRVRLNGKGPFNFLVDTGAPALFIATETAKKAGLKPATGAFWTPVERFEVEGGATLTGIKARVEDPYQLVGMNALGLPGASIDGLIGYTVLARFRVELDPTRDRMTWTRLDFEPNDPAEPKVKPGAKAATDLPGMNAVGALTKVVAALVGKQPEEVRVPRGFLGLELIAAEGGVRVGRVLPGSPASKAGVVEGDRLLRVGGRPVGAIGDARAAVAGVAAGDRVELAVRRDGEAGERALSVTAGEGL